jgi:hypothetical protein
MIEFIGNLKEFCMDIVPYGYTVDISAHLKDDVVNSIYLRKIGSPEIISDVSIYSYEGAEVVSVNDVIEQFSSLIPDYKFDKKMKYNEKCEALV